MPADWPEQMRRGLGAMLRYSASMPNVHVVCDGDVDNVWAVKQENQD